MATVVLNSTRLTCEILTNNAFDAEPHIRLRIALKNAYLDYVDDNRRVEPAEMEEWIFSMRRLLAGAYGKERSLTFENAGFAVDLYPHTVDGKEVSREERRKNDCLMAVRMLMRSEDEKSFLGGVYTLLLHREEIDAFSQELRKELDERYSSFTKGEGPLMYAGVSPLGCSGCCYWYFDEAGTRDERCALQKGDYVWVKMGKRQIEQIVLVDQVRRFSTQLAPFDPDRVKRILRPAVAEEIENRSRDGE